MVDLKKLSPEAKEARKATLEEKKTLTGRISETSRFVSFGIVAYYYGLRTADDKFSATMLKNTGYVLDVMAVCAVLSVIADYLQYYFGTKSASRALEADDQLYDKTKYDYKLRAFFYSTKQILTLASAILLLASIVQNMWLSPH